MTKRFVWLLCLTFLTGCSSVQNGEKSQYAADKAALEAATTEGTSKAFDQFIVTHPKSDWTAVAIYRRDHAALEEAKSLGTKEALEEFLRKYPNSDWAEQARYFLKYGRPK